MVLAILHCCHLSLLCGRYIQGLEFAGEDACTLHTLGSTFCRNYGTSQHLVVQPECPENQQLYNIFVHLQTISDDIETNPGPTDLDAVLLAIKESETKVLTQIESVKSDITELKTNLQEIKVENSEIKANLKKIETNQESLKTDLALTDGAVEKLQDVSETQQLDIDHICSSMDDQSGKIDQINEDIERLNIKSISNNMRVFGITLDPELNSDQRTDFIIKRVLKVACPDSEWYHDDIKAVRVIPSTDPTAPPLIIVTFRYDDDKFQVYKGRDALRNIKIKVGDDLTYKQRQVIKAMKQKGKTAYYYKGELCVRSDTLESESEQPREFRRAFRKLTSTIDQNLELSEANTAEVTTTDMDIQ